MKKNTLFIAVVALLLILAYILFTAGKAEAQEVESSYVDYMTLSLGANDRSNEDVDGLPSNFAGGTDNDWGQSGYLTVGKEVYPQVDVELELGVNQNDGKFSLTKSYRRYSRTYTTDYDIASYSAGINTRYSIDQLTIVGVTPNVFVGAGAESVHFDNGTFGGSETGLYGQVGLGIEKPINDNFSLISDYRFRKGQDINFQGFEIDNEVQVFTIGAKLKL